MPISTEDSIVSRRIQVTDGRKGFHPYLIVVKNSGTYLEGEPGRFLHVSMHSRPLQNDPELASCHLTMPREIEPEVRKEGFSDRRYFAWKRRIGLAGQCHLALKLIFPSMYGTNRVFPVEDSDTERVELRETATVVDFWFSGLEVDSLEEWLSEFGRPLLVQSLPNGETLGINVVVEMTRDYSTFERADSFGSYTLAGEGDAPETEQCSLFVGPFGTHCYGILHGRPEERPHRA